MFLCDCLGLKNFELQRCLFVVRTINKTTLPCLLFSFHSQRGGVFYIKGRLNISGGNFFRNVASEDGGVVFASDESSVTVYDGQFEGNEALEGGVIYVSKDTTLIVQGGIFTRNTGENGGGAFWTKSGGNIEVRILLCFRKREGRGVNV